MRNLTEREESILLSARQLCEKYANKNLAYNGHEIWHLAHDAAVSLTLRYDCPLAYQLASELVSYASSLYREAHAA